MQVCSQCGTVISSQATSCPSCGLQISSNNSVSDILETPLQKMEKGITKSLQDNARNFVQKQAHEQLEKISKAPVTNAESMDQSSFEQMQPAAPTNQKGIIQSAEVKKRSSISFVFWIYIALNLALAYFGYMIYEVMFVLMISFLTVITVLIRAGSPKPFNWLAKLLLIAQTAAYIFLEMRWLDYLFELRISQIIIALLLVNLILVFKGNRTTN
ncbi:MAG: zinc ribbon domain-containing protein [Lacibacter sp.]